MRHTIQVYKRDSNCCPNKLNGTRMENGNETLSSYILYSNPVEKIVKWLRKLTIDTIVGAK